MCKKLRTYKLRTYKLLLLLWLPGAYSIKQMGLYLQVNTLLVIYKSRYYSINVCSVLFLAMLCINDTDIKL